MRADFILKNTETSEKGSRSLIMVLAVLAFFIFSFTIIRSTLINVKELHSSLKKEQASLVKLKAKLSVLKTLDTPTLKSRVDLIESVFPSQKPAMNLIATLKKVAIENEVSFSGFTLNPGEIQGKVKTAKNSKNKANSDTSGKLESFNINISLIGPLAKIFAFIEQLKTTAPLVTIQSLSINTLPNQAEDLIKATISIKVYYQSPPHNIGTIEEPIRIFTDEEERIFASLADYVVYPEPDLIPFTEGKADFFSQNSKVNTHITNPSAD